MAVLLVLEGLCPLGVRGCQAQLGGALASLFCQGKNWMPIGGGTGVLFGVMKHMMPHTFGVLAGEE